MKNKYICVVLGVIEYLIFLETHRGKFMFIFITLKSKLAAFCLSDIRSDGLTMLLVMLLKEWGEGLDPFCFD